MGSSVAELKEEDMPKHQTKYYSAIKEAVSFRRRPSEPNSERIVD